eukprot:CAMPEP_0177538740 /NCGR_PEP_ID=MMETSP0369-20130122/58567_1 /TAXON_ID=447022 ORGANISM="Scrippsiella hangoei-like, Strain SHHI-4" /NCGR_SAMPLE_ID=MMETSP0369 /ASSEMBLY_ACC=CAM_ASM_000364 /LENGTH=248 /DNA_ID=CAMNT_0019021629 /DNA_START=1 /DNA_END=747 /DNA_ORIENTATION=+
MCPAPLLAEFGPWLSLVICSYIAFCLFALMNIVTGVFVESAMQTAKSDRDMFMLQFVRQLFVKADTDGTGCLTWAKFKATLDSEEMDMYFEAMDLDIQEAKDLFRLLDADGSGEAEYTAANHQFQVFAKQVEDALAWMVEALGGTTHQPMADAPSRPMRLSASSGGRDRNIGHEEEHPRHPSCRSSHGHPSCRAAESPMFVQTSAWSSGSGGSTYGAADVVYPVGNVDVVDAMVDIEQTTAAITQIAV